jgi:hypothetical protein
LSEKPLHVRVAEALGWTHVYEAAVMGLFSTALASDRAWIGTPPEGGAGLPVYRYDTDWSATGPLIERYGIDLTLYPKHWTASGHPERGGTLSCPGDTPLLAVCELIVTAKGSGLALREKH